jgi:lipopolysaccharide export system protein LptA
MSRRSFSNSVTLVLSLLLLAATPAPFTPEKGTREPIVVTSKRMEAEKLGNTVTFVGDVVLKKEEMTLQADRLVVHYDPEQRIIREMDAVGHVVVTQEDRVAMGEKAVYYSNEEKIVLTGDPRIIEKENELRGEKITLYMRENRSIVEGGKVFFYQDKTEQGTMKSPFKRTR